MPTKIQKWGNSLAVRLPKKIVHQLGLKRGSEVMVNEREQKVVIAKVVPPKHGMRKEGWKHFMIPTNKKKENVSGKVDEILYGNGGSHR